jgi:hypothetical protein
MSRLRQRSFEYSKSSVTIFRGPVKTDWLTLRLRAERCL